MVFVFGEHFFHDAKEPEKMLAQSDLLPDALPEGCWFIGWCLVLHVDEKQGVNINRLKQTFHQRNSTTC